MPNASKVASLLLYAITRPSEVKAIITYKVRLNPPNAVVGSPTER